MSDVHTVGAPAPLAPARGRIRVRLLAREIRWGLTWQGYLAAALALAAVGWIAVTHAYRFLALTERTEARVLVVEGWVHNNVIQAAAAEYRAGAYRDVFSTGGPVEGTGGYINDYSTSAAVGAARLKAAGIPADQVTMAPARHVDRDRTYASAVALRNLLQSRSLAVTALNLVTADVHARRTRLLFQAAFGPRVAIGVISIPSPDYDARHWWRYSEGVRDVLSEAVSYVYARCFFSAPAERGSDASASVRSLPTD